MSELPSGWASATVGEIAGLTDGPFGSNLKTSHYLDAGPRVVRLQNIGDGVFHDEHAHIATEHFEHLAKHEVRSGDIVAASLGDNPPRACLVPGWLGPAIVKADCIRIRAVAGVEPAFLMWMLNSPPVRAEGAARVKGVGRPRLGLGGIRQLAVPVPPLTEQRRIVAAIEEHLSRLDAADALLAQARRRLNALRSAALAAAASGPWPLIPISDLATETLIGLDRSRERQSRDPQGRRPYVRMGNIDADGRMTWDDLTFVDITEREEERFRLHAGDLLFNTRNSRELVGKVGLVRNPPDGAVFNNNLMRIRLREDLDPGYAWAAMNSPRFRSSLDSVKNATTNVAAIYAKNLLPLELPLPPLEEQLRIVAEVEERLSVIDAMRTGIASAQRRSAVLRASILERAFRGELVPQDPSDEPASALLDRIRAEQGNPT